MKGKRIYLFIALVVGLLGWRPASEKQKEQPNILWIYIEDLNPVFSCYGVENNPTPFIDQLADQGVLFSNAYTPSPVCSAARSAIITSTMATSLGTHNHHSSRTVEDAIFLPEGVKTVPELFKEAGYYTFNHGKDDYNFIYDRKKLYSDPIKLDYWYTFAGKGNWIDSLSSDRPFFGQIQLAGGKLALSQTYGNHVDKITPIDRNAVEVPPYYPDIPWVREDWARHHDAARLTDLEVAEIIEKLRKKGLLDNTYIFLFSDHGYKGIRHKQFLYDGGTKIPLIVSYFGDDTELKKGKERKDLVNGIDIGTSSLRFAGLPIPTYMEGKDLFDRKNQRDYVITTRDRCDFSIDRIRAVRTEKYKYIRNFMPHRSYTQPSYRDKRKEFTQIKKAFEEGKLNEVQAKYWLPTKPEEEFYDLENDPHEIHNLATDESFQKELEKHRLILENWIEETDDKGQYPENPYALKFIYDRWGKRCVNEEYEAIKKIKVWNTPKKNLKF
ncbi:arylsulfatase A-like enzyme [Sediminitomix flava]|uniref:Arylsulfatase A-like enzyme n=2 Tax=Sediminitomix flava TaxID=379075 RepID=A0A315YYJ8_SEDFL|nr:arylsulfatase A-like enzyme [Sediminitomix flava]